MTPLAFVQVAIPVVVLLIDALIWLLFGQFVVLPWIDEQMGGKQPWWKRAVMKPVRFIEHRAQRLLERLKADAAARFALASPPLARWLHRNALILEQLSGVIVSSNEATFKALATLRHVTIPTMIANALRSVLSRVTILEARVQALVQARTADLVELRDTLRQLPWGGSLITTAPYRAFLASYRHLWTQFFDVVKPQMTELLTQTIPDLRTRLAALERRVEIGIDARLDALGSRVTVLENRIENAIVPRIAALELAVETLVDATLAPIGAQLLALTTRVVELERQVQTVIADALTALDARLDVIETELEQAVAGALDSFGETILELERQVTTVIPQRLAALELAVDTLVATALGGLEVGLVDLTGRVVALETQIRDVILPGFDAILGRISALEERIANTILPRITALEEILAPAAFGALVVATMRRVAPNLFCRNVTSTTERICAIDETLFAELLAGTLLFSLILDPRVVVRTGQTIEGVIEGAYRTMADL